MSFNFSASLTCAALLMPLQLPTAPPCWFQVKGKAFLQDTGTQKGNPAPRPWEILIIKAKRSFFFSSPYKESETPSLRPSRLTPETQLPAS